jgi:hypothetical protein
MTDEGESDGGSDDEIEMDTRQEQTRRELFGAIDPGAIRDVRELFREEEPLVESATIDDPLNPQTLVVELTDGVGDATTARIDVRWSVTGNYAFHYTDGEERDLRFDCHPKPDAPRRHFHSPPDAPRTPVERSCIEVHEVELVARAVLKQWRTAYERGAFDAVNDADDPP